MSDGSSIPAHLAIYTKEYFAGEEIKSGYTDYHTCRGVLNMWSHIIDGVFHPASILDVGAAYGFLVENFRSIGVPAFGVDPSDWALSQVAPAIQPYVVKGQLPDLPDFGQRFDVVTCTEVLEHVPEDLVPASLAALAAQTERFLVMLIMLDIPGADGDEGHICLKSSDWWHWQLTRTTGFVQRHDLEFTLNNLPYSKEMQWAGRFFVRERVATASGGALTASSENLIDAQTEPLTRPDPRPLED